MADLLSIKLTRLSVNSKEYIATLLNSIKVIPSSNGKQRDWRGVAEILFNDNALYQALAISSNPSKEIFQILKKKFPDFTIKNFIEILEKIERFDIIDDILQQLEEEADLYHPKENHSSKVHEPNLANDILTFDDSLEKQVYDAYILYADEDLTFAEQIIENLETENLKICWKERDLTGGIDFEHEAVMKLISERCHRLIVIISPDFLHSSLNKFFLNYAQASAIDKQQQRKIIPCIYKPCDLPIQVKYMTKIYFDPNKSRYFFDRLVGSVSTFKIKNENKRVLQKNIFQNQSISNNTIEQEITISNNNTVSDNNVPASISKNITPSDVSLQLPSLDDLDSLSSQILSQNKKKSKKSFIKKVRALIKN